MIFNFTKNYKFATRLKMNGQNLPVLNQTKLLGTVITDDLKWDKNIQEIVKKANARRILLRRASEYTTSLEDLKTIYISYVRSILEQSSVIWHSSLTTENIEDLERVPKMLLE